MVGDTDSSKAYLVEATFSMVCKLIQYTLGSICIFAKPVAGLNLALRAHVMCKLHFINNLLN